MKRFIIAALIGLTSTTRIQAQNALDAGTPVAHVLNTNRPALHGTNSFANSPFADLKLTDAQKAQIGTLSKDAGIKMRDVMTDKTLDKDVRIAKIKALQEERLAGLKKILTPEQSAKLETKQKAMKEEFLKRCAAQAAAGAPAPIKSTK